MKIKKTLVKLPNVSSVTWRDREIKKVKKGLGIRTDINRKEITRNKKVKTKRAPSFDEALAPIAGLKS